MKYQLCNKWNLNNHGQCGECNEERKSENRQKAIAKIQVTDDKKTEGTKDEDDKRRIRIWKQIRCGNY